MILYTYGLFCFLVKCKEGFGGVLRMIIAWQELWRWQAGTIIQESVFICRAQQNGGGGLRVFNKRKCPRETLPHEIWREVYYL